MLPGLREGVDIKLLALTLARGDDSEVTITKQLCKAQGCRDAPTTPGFSGQSPPSRRSRQTLKRGLGAEGIPQVLLGDRDGVARTPQGSTFRRESGSSLGRQGSPGRAGLAKTAQIVPETTGQAVWMQPCFLEMNLAATGSPLPSPPSVLTPPLGTASVIPALLPQGPWASQVTGLQSPWLDPKLANHSTVF